MPVNSDTRSPQSISSRITAASRRSLKALALAGVDQGGQLLVGEDRHRRRFRLVHDDPGQRVLGQDVLGHQPVDEPAQATPAGADGAGRSGPGPAGRPASPATLSRVRLRQVSRETLLGQPPAEVVDGLAVEDQGAVGLALHPKGAVEAAAQGLQGLGHVSRLSGECRAMLVVG